MKKLILKFVIFCFLFCLLLPQTATAVSRAYLQKKCRDNMKNNPPEIVINYNYGELIFNHELTAEEIKKLYGKNNKAKDDTLYYGLTLMKFYQSIDIEHNIEKYEKSNFVCMFPQTIRIYVGFTNPTIYIDKNLENGSCVQQKTLRHELNHLDNAHTFLNALVLALKTHISEIIMNTGPVFNEDKKLYFSQITDFINVYNEKWQQNENLTDNDENYHEEAKICH